MFKDVFVFVLDSPPPVGVWGRVLTAIVLRESVDLSRFRLEFVEKRAFYFHVGLKHSWVIGGLGKLFWRLVLPGLSTCAVYFPICGAIVWVPVFLSVEGG